MTTTMMMMHVCKCVGVHACVYARKCVCKYVCMHVDKLLRCSDFVRLKKAPYNLTIIGNVDGDD